VRKGKKLAIKIYYQVFNKIGLTMKTYILAF